MRICAHICTCGRCLHAQLNEGVHTHTQGCVWLCTALCLRHLLLLHGMSHCPKVSRLGISGALAGEEKHFLGTLEIRKI